jgi:hypothetical protein
MNIKYWFWKNFSICSYCKRRRATWSYMPGDEDACDHCVPRGCSCNLEYEGEELENCEEPKFYKEPLDDFGRRLPCCEWEPIRTNPKELKRMGLDCSKKRKYNMIDV